MHWSINLIRWLCRKKIIWLHTHDCCFIFDWKYNALEVICIGNYCQRCDRIWVILFIVFNKRKLEEEEKETSTRTQQTCHNQMWLINRIKLSINMYTWGTCQIVTAKIVFGKRFPEIFWSEKTIITIKCWLNWQLQYQSSDYVCCMAVSGCWRALNHMYAYIIENPC